MFQWLRIEVSKHPRFVRTPLQTGAAELKIDSTPHEAEVVPGLHPKRSESDGEEAYTTNTSELIDELWRFLLDEHNVLVMPARLFQVEKPGVDQTDRLNYFRATFAGDRDEIESALEALGKGVKEWFERG
jgi:aromatic amino acid aminotransferase I